MAYRYQAGRCRCVNLDLAFVGSIGTHSAAPNGMSVVGSFALMFDMLLCDWPVAEWVIMLYLYVT